MNNASGFWMLYYREYRRIVRVIKQTVFTPLANSALYLLIFGVSLGSSIELKNGIPYLIFLVPGLIMMGALNNAYQNSSSSVTNSKFHGELQDLRVVPLSFQQIVWALSLGGLTRGILVGGLNFVMGSAFSLYLYGEWLPVEHPFLLLAFILVGSLVFAHLGIAVAFWAKGFDQLTAVGSFILIPLMYLGGVFYSISSLPSFWQAVTKWNPLFYLINGVRYGMLGQSDVEPYFALGVSVVALVLLSYVSSWCVKNGSYQKF
ncbi:MAG: ABC transporter permease [Bdellovibrionales bacterium]